MVMLKKFIFSIVCKKKKMHTSVLLAQREHPLPAVQRNWGKPSLSALLLNTPGRWI
jgi:hypothetical protein